MNAWLVTEFLDSDILMKCVWRNNWQSTGVHTHRNWWTTNRLIAWVTNRNVRSYISCNCSREEGRYSTWLLSIKLLVVTLGFKICNIMGGVLGVCNSFLMGFAPCAYIVTPNISQTDVPSQERSFPGVNPHITPIPCDFIFRIHRPVFVLGTRTLK